MSIDFYFRCFVLVFDSQLKAKESVANIGNAYFCLDCHSFYQQNFGTSVATKGNSKFVPTNTHNFNINKCSNCEGCLKFAGPLWLGKLHDNEFVKSVINHVEKDTKNTYGTKKRMIGMLNLIAEELPNPFYYVLDEISSVMHCETPNHSVFRSAILNANYQVSYSHCSQNSVKTNAPTSFIFSVLKKWSELKPINEKWLVPQFRVYHILKNLEDIKIDLTINENSIPPSKKDKLLRFQEPPPFWGPKAKPKRKISEEDEIIKKDKQRKETDISAKSKNDDLPI
jgi:tRNA (guanine26-N2/guanine27-N2)-dimethyltransferase